MGSLSDDGDASTVQKCMKRQRGG